MDSQGQVQGLDLQGQGQGQKIWPRGSSRPRPGLEDYITANYVCNVHCANDVTTGKQAEWQTETTVRL